MHHPRQGSSGVATRTSITTASGVPETGRPAAPVSGEAQTLPRSISKRFIGRSANIGSERVKHLDIECAAQMLGMSAGALRMPWNAARSHANGSGPVSGFAAWTYLHLVPTLAELRTNASVPVRSDSLPLHRDGSRRVGAATPTTNRVVALASASRAPWAR